MQPLEMIAPDRQPFIRGMWRANRGLSSKAIECFGMSVMSHVDIMLANGDLVGARSDQIYYRGRDPRFFGGYLSAGVQLRPHDYESCNEILVLEKPVSHDQHRLCMQFLAAQIGKDYDKIGILDFALCRNRWRDWRDPSSWWCSELFAGMLEHGGVIAEIPRVLGCMINPGMAAHEFIGAGAVQAKWAR
jgi:hypothetical protein